jgi:4-amino-4-deoxy-L-arabinose transferase-like glycosyltransferase
MNQKIHYFLTSHQFVNNDTKNLFLIIAIWVIMVIAVNPAGDFPLNDDWAYGYSVKVLLEQGDLNFSGWTATNLVAQVFWGALFSLPFGFSFTALRFSTLFLGIIGVLAAYGLFREVESPPQLALLGALLIAVNPIYFWLSNTFMNDVPFAVIATVSLYLLLRGLKKDSPTEIVIGLIFAGIAILTRQVGLAIPMVFSCAFLIKEKFSWRNLVIAAIPIMFGFGLQIGFQTWLHLTSRIPLKFGNQIDTMMTEISHGPHNVIYNYFTITLFTLVYLGLFLFPILLLLFFTRLQQLSIWNRILSLSTVVIISSAIMATLSFDYGLMPLRGNILVDFGLGPVILKNSRPILAPRLFWVILTAVGSVGAILILQYLFLALKQIINSCLRPEIATKRWIMIFVIAAITISYLPLGFLGLGPFGFYDRYLIFFLPLLLMLILISTTNLSHWQQNHKWISIASAMLICYGAFTVAGTHDSLTWNRLRWQTLHTLMEEKEISPHQIDGGFEFNGWYLYDDKYEYDPTFEKSWYWVDGDDYVVSFNSLVGYKELERYPFSRWLPWGQESILVLRRTAEFQNQEFP